MCEHILDLELPFFSIITVVRNNLNGLKKTKDSISKQAFKEWEWLIIDGASTDGTREFAFQCGGNQVRVISESDRGIFDAMNKGLQLAKGRYVIFMNSGDLLATEASLKEAHAVCCTESPDVLFGSSIMDFGFMRLHRAAKPTSYIWHGQPGLHQATVFSREKHLQFLYNLNYRVCGDYDVITRMARAGLSLISAPVLLSVNEFNAAANSGKRKIQLISEAARAQRHNFNMSPFIIALSVLRRLVASIATKAITWMELMRIMARRQTDA